MRSRRLRAIVLVCLVGLPAPGAHAQDKAASTAVAVDRDKRTITFDPKTCTAGRGFLTTGLGHYEVRVLGREKDQCRFVFVVEQEMGETHYLVRVPVDSGPVTIRPGKTLGSHDTSFPLDKALVVRRCGGKQGTQEVRVGETDAFVRFSAGEIPRSEMRPKAGDAVKFLCRVYDGPDYKTLVPSRFTYPTAEFVVGASGDWLWLETAMEEMTVGDRRRVEVPAKAAPGVKAWLPDGTKAETLYVEVGLLALTLGDDRPLGNRLEALFPHAAGVALVTIEGSKDIERRAGDGPLVREVRWKTVRGSGTLRDGVSITLAPGGHPAPPGAVRPAGPDFAATADTFKVGERYWVVFSSRPETAEKYPQGVMRVWAEKEAPKVLDEAVRADHYARCPHYHPRTGLTCCDRETRDQRGWLIRVERDGRKLWETTVPGKVTQSTPDLILCHREMPTGLDHLDRATTNWFLRAETRATLDATNPYQVPAGSHRVMRYWDAETGNVAAVQVVADEGGRPSVTRYYDLATGKVRREERFDALSSGGRAAGADTEGWLRKTVRTFDPATGRVTGGEIFRHATTPEGSTYVPVKK